MSLCRCCWWVVVGGGGGFRLTLMMYRKPGNHRRTTCAAGGMLPTVQRPAMSLFLIRNGIFWNIRCSSTCYFCFFQTWDLLESDSWSLEPWTPLETNLSHQWILMMACRQFWFATEFLFVREPIIQLVLVTSKIAHHPFWNHMVSIILSSLFLEIWKLIFVVNVTLPIRELLCAFLYMIFLFVHIQCRCIQDTPCYPAL